MKSQAIDTATDLAARRPRMRLGGHVVADQLVVHGTELAFCVPGESYLPLLDGLYRHRARLRVITCRHEAAASHAAEAYGKLTGRPGVCMVTRGPGAMHAAVGVHTAMQDSTPLLVLVGQVARAVRGREGFQELDYERVFSPICKWAFEVDRPERVPELMARAYATAAGGRPGPVVLALPEDMLFSDVEIADAKRYQAQQPAPAAETLTELRGRLDAARRPLVVVGGGPWDELATQQFERWAESNALPVVSSFRRQDIVDNEAPCYVGSLGADSDPRLVQRVVDADLVIAVGTRLSEIETQGYSLPLADGRSLVHVHPDPQELGRVFQPDLPILAGMRPFAAALAALDAVEAGTWREWSAQARAEYVTHLRHDPAPGNGVDLGAVMAHLRETLPGDSVICNGAGNFTAWVHRFYQFTRFGTQLAPQSGAMGYGVPAALAAQLVHPDRTVVAFAGDGDFQMCGQELATLAQAELPVLVLVVNNGVLGSIRMQQERRYPGRPIATDLANPDFVALGRAYGAYAARVESAAQFPAALAEARAAGRLALIELVCDPEALTPSKSLSAIREDGMRALRPGD